MSIPSLIFYFVFVLPLVVFLVWLMRQDKRMGLIGLLVVAVTVIFAVLYAGGLQGVTGFMTLGIMAAAAIIIWMFLKMSRK